MIDAKAARSLNASSSARGKRALAIILVAPVALALAAIYYFTLAYQASVHGGFPLWDMFRLSVHDIRPHAEYRFIGFQLIAREYLYQFVFFSFFAVISGVGAINHCLLRARDRRIVATLKNNDLL